MQASTIQSSTCVAIAIIHSGPDLQYFRVKETCPRVGEEEGKQFTMLQGLPCLRSAEEEVADSSAWHRNQPHLFDLNFNTNAAVLFDAHGLYLTGCITENAICKYLCMPPITCCMWAATHLPSYRKQRMPTKSAGSRSAPLLPCLECQYYPMSLGQKIYTSHCAMSCDSCKLLNR